MVFPGGDPTGYIERGTASWYGPGFHGKKTANGETYDMHALTAAHQTLPLGSIALVRSLSNGKTVTVRINDRGPFVGGRILDLSYAGAQALEMIGPGTDEIELRVVAYRGKTLASSAFRIQVGSFAELERAQALMMELETSHYNARIVPASGEAGQTYRVQVGYYQSESQAEAVARRLSRLLNVTPLIVADQGP